MLDAFFFFCDSLQIVLNVCQNNIEICLPVVDIKIKQCTTPSPLSSFVYLRSREPERRRVAKQIPRERERDRDRDRRRSWRPRSWLRNRCTRDLRSNSRPPT